MASRLLTLLFWSMVGSMSLVSQTKVSDHIYRADDQTPLISASVERLFWLSGHWRAEEWGGSCQEHWSPPLGGSMMGMFKYVREGQVKIYEFITIVEENNTLFLKIKHFTSHMKGWEHKDSSVTFRLVKLEEHAAYFDTQTYKKIDETTLMVYFITGSKGELKQEAFRFVRQD